MSVFRPSLRRLAPSISKTPFTSLPTTDLVDTAAQQLLPPLALYRRLLRVHRKVLPIELKVMGDEYVKAEFRRTSSTENPLHIVGFLSEWKKYLDHHEQIVREGEGTSSELEQGEEGRKIKWGKKLDVELFERLSADQLGQLYELMQATKEVYMSPEEIAAKHGSSSEGIPDGQVLPDLGKK
ncbi:BQ2448_7795 [Microbotryum intermedium]|uniref:Succinate dehydrogenase assembly factor 3 n=1 Tax=Microbotryum intermedium TaxID=269621 RepID=A0A238FUM1_9BASI|nr:BQ2448_7795 [Microbotryum intermedium]